MEEHNPSPPENSAAHSALALRELQERAQAALAASRNQAARLEADITRQLDAITATLSEQPATDAGHTSESDSLRHEIARLNNDLDNSRTAWLAERTDLELERDALHQKVSDLETRLQASQSEWRNQLLGFESRLREQQKSWNDQRTDWATTRTMIERERNELQQKFDLALEDVQRLRARVAELEQDLARRPESNQADSAELVGLRAERDALAARVEELEERPTTQIDPNVEQQLADLQRRFELAVEDVRELKTKNAKLESQLASAGSASKSHSASDANGMDWESQKRRLLAALEDGDGSSEPIPKKERVTIEGTIEMTDAIVAEKDRKIAELQSQLAAGDHENVPDEVQEDKINDLLDADEIIAQHRERVRDLEREMEAKLRTAELELSVERAKMARQRAELDELQSDLESKRQEYEATGVPPVQGAPRRRWLSKLGLTGEES